MVFFVIISLSLLSLCPPNTEMSFIKALNEKKVEIRIKSTGNYSGHCINLTVKNLSDNTLNLKMKPGTTFVPDNVDEQTLLTVKEHILALKKGTIKTIKIYGYCSEMSDRSPSISSKFKISKTNNDSLQSLISFLGTVKGLSQNIIQQSVWCISDGNSVSNVYNDDLTTTKAMRDYLCGATKQENTWYNTERDVQVDVNNYIINSPTVIKGKIKFTTTKPSDIEGFIKGPNGEVIMKYPNKMSFPAGNMAIDFKLKVRGWAEGEYHVIYTNGTEEILNQSFTI